MRIPDVKAEYAVLADPVGSGAPSVEVELTVADDEAFQAG